MRAYTDRGLAPESSSHRAIVPRLPVVQGTGLGAAATGADGAATSDPRLLRALRSGHADGRLLAPAGLPMFFVLEDDGAVHVYASPDAAVLQIEALDADECVRAAFDDEGCPYHIEWIEPNHHGRSFLGVQSVGNGRYKLVPSGPPDPAAFLALFRDDRPVSAANDLPAVEALLERLRESVSRG